jgi:hypothetical protein
VANVIHYIGDELPLYVPEELTKYPMFAQVKAVCDDSSSGCINALCEKSESETMEPIILPLNRKRHFGIAVEVPRDDIFRGSRKYLKQYGEESTRRLTWCTLILQVRILSMHWCSSTRIHPWWMPSSQSTILMHLQV